MPIIDPSLQYCLLRTTLEDTVICSELLVNYLKLASEININQNVNTIEAHNTFRKDLIANLRTVCSIFQSKISIKKSFYIPNYYKFLYDYLYDVSFTDKERSGWARGIETKEYYCFDQVNHLFYLKRPGCHGIGSWLFTDSSLAIFVCDNFKSFKNKSRGELRQRLGLLNLEIGTMTPANLTTILICQFDPETVDIAKDFIQYTMKDHFFSEIHFNLENPKWPQQKEKYTEVLSTLLQNFGSFKGYFYLYMPFVSKFPKCQQILDILKQNPCFQVICVSKRLGEVFNEYKPTYVGPFPVYQDGISFNQIRVSLSNVSIYDEQNDSAVSDFSGIGYGFIKNEDFLNLEKKFVPIIYKNATKYVNFDDLHTIKPDLYVKNNMYLMEIDEKVLHQVDSIIKKAKLDDVGEFKRRRVSSVSESKKVQKLLTYITRSFGEMTRDTDLIKLRPNQVFAALEACSIFSKNDKNSDPNSKKGFIYQVHTGEGKSYIIQAIAAVQALMGKTVHIATSNIFLANRDYHDSYEFFTNLGLKPCVLLHKSEMPIFQKKEDIKANSNDDDENFNFLKERYPSNFFGDDLFENSSGMNINVCGVDIYDHAKAKSTANIIYSTFINFEAFFLRFLEMNPNAIAKYFQNCCLLIDEADSILIDELTNGTILSRPMNTNGKEILVFVYNCKMDNLQPSEVLSGIKEMWPECTDINEDDIKAMYKEIDLVKTPEFQNGLKYCVESMLIDHSEDENVMLNLFNKLKDAKEKFDDIKDKVSSYTTAEFYVEKIKEHKEKKALKRAQSTPNVDTKFKIKKHSKAKDDDDKPKEKKHSRKKDHGKSKSKKHVKIKIDGDEQVDVQEVEQIEAQEVEQIEVQEVEQVEVQEVEQVDVEAVEQENAKKNMIKRTQSQAVFRISEEDKKSNQKVRVNYIVPFDYDHKGILEPNKEFNGFVQQFIAIKEMTDNPEKYKHMFIKDVSMSYLYVSHPIFVRYYNSVCGLTGTLGGSYEEEIFSEKYNLNTLNIPRNGPLRRVNMPTTLCKNIKERNRLIVDEIVHFSNRGNPVLIIFQNLNEINVVYSMLKKHGFNNINVFNGKDQSIKPDFIAGRKCAISLGTNVCGRGTDIKNPVKPLHVIISYITSNIRVMQQAYGRTGRKGTQGSVHIICLRKQCFEPLEIVKSNNLNNVLNDFELKNELQIKFIEKFKKKREWIFTPITRAQMLDSKTIGQLRDAQINVNRIVAYKFKFPLGLNIDTFLKIQAQKIFSLFNCPNSKYTWQLFQRYIREMIFESWSLFIDKTERYFLNERKDTNTEEYMYKEYDKLLKIISNYIPDESDFGVVETFMFIYNKVVKDWQDRIYKYIPETISCFPLKQTNPNRFITFNIGFRPFNLINKSGARISEACDENTEAAYIEDPEISYIRQEQKSGTINFIKVSITEAIDKIFNKVCNIFNEYIGALLGIKFFLRRTLGGCEFGLCFDSDIANTDAEFIKENCLIDRDPLLIFTISIRSIAPLLAGVLIFGLVYLASVSATVSEYITAFPQKITSNLAKKTIKFAIEQFIINCCQDKIVYLCNVVIKFLHKKLDESMEIINLYNSRLYNIFKVLSSVVDNSEFANASESIQGLFEDSFISIKSSVLQGIATNGIPVPELIKMGIMLILCLASFLISFNYHKKALAHGSNTETKQQKDAMEFDKDHSSKENLERLIDKNKDDDDVKSLNKKKYRIEDDDDARKLIEELKQKVKDKNKK